MPSNPFYSGRIPPELLDAIEKHRELTGESKTDLLIKALSQYVGFQLEEKEPELPPIHHKLDEVFRRLEKLEKSVFNSNKNMIIEENLNPEVDPNQIEIDFNTEEENTDNRMITNKLKDEEEILNSNQLVALLGISKSTLSKWKKKNLFPKIHKNYEVKLNTEKSTIRGNSWIVRKSDNNR